MKYLLLGLALTVSNALAVTVDFTSMAAACSASVVSAGLTVTGSANVCTGTFAGVSGIGVSGGGTGVSLDPGETMTFNFGGLVSNVNVQIWDVDPPGNVNFSFTAFDGATNLGTFAVTPLAANPTTYNFTTIAGQQFSSFTLGNLTSPASIGLQIQQVSFDSTVPEPTTLSLLGLGLAGLFGAQQRRNRTKRQA